MQKKNTNNKLVAHSPMVPERPAMTACLLAHRKKKKKRNKTKKEKNIKMKKTTAKTEKEKNDEETHQKMKKNRTN